MKSVFNETDRAELAARVDRLADDTAPLWGRMSCRQMLAHVSDGVRMSIGELPVRSKGGPLRIKPIRHAIIYWLPFPKGAPTAPELLARSAECSRTEAAELKT